jgi:hypothetical protein
MKDEGDAAPVVVLAAGDAAAAGEDGPAAEEAAAVVGATVGVVPLADVAGALVGFAVGALVAVDDAELPHAASSAAAAAPIPARSASRRDNDEETSERCFTAHILVVLSTISVVPQRHACVSSCDRTDGALVCASLDMFTVS